MLALQSLLPEAYGEMSKSATNNHSRLCQLERESLGVDHAQVGTWLAELWGLPEGYLLAIRESHDLDLETVPADLRDEVECVFLAGCLAEIWLNPDSRDEGIWKKLLSHTNETTLESITSDVQEWFSNLSHLFQVPVLDSARADQVLLEAREQLAEVSLRNLQRTEQIERERQRLAANNLELRKRTFRDALTGLYNRAYLEDVVTESYRGLADTKGYISVLFCDVNRFKKFNDTYGHKCGDEILAAVGQAIGSLIRPDDKAIRFGGDEFLLILPGADAELATNIAKRLCTAVADVQIEAESGQQLSVSISAGCATHSADSPYDSIEALCNAADFELYRVKRSREEDQPIEKSTAATENRIAS